MRTHGWRHTFRARPWEEIASFLNDMVTASPVVEPSLDVVIVRAPSSMHRPSSGHVLIEQQSRTGHDDRIERPAAEAVPLFWRFMMEKSGVHPAG